MGSPRRSRTTRTACQRRHRALSEYVNHGHQVLVERSAGVGSGFADSEYAAAGATLIDTHAEVFARADMIVKVKEPIEPEYELMREGQLLYTYLHLAARSG